MGVVNQSKLLPELIREIETEVSDQQHLKDVMDWALSDPAGNFMPQVIANVVVQDEFTQLFQRSTSNETNHNVSGAGRCHAFFCSRLKA